MIYVLQSMADTSLLEALAVPLPPEWVLRCEGTFSCHKELTCGIGYDAFSSLNNVSPVIFLVFLYNIDI